MGITISRRINEFEINKPLKCHLAFEKKSFGSDTKYVFVTEDKFTIFHTGSNYIPNKNDIIEMKYAIDVYFNSEDYSFIGCVEKLENYKNLYHIQDGKELTDFNDLYVENTTKNLAFVVKMERSYVKNINTVDFYFSDIKNYDTLRDYIKYYYDMHSIQDNIPIDEYILPVYSSNNYNIDNKQFKNTINKWKGYSYDDLNINIDDFYFIHNTHSFEKIVSEKKLCNLGDCVSTSFDEKTGIFRKNDLEYNSRWGRDLQPGIYFTQFPYLEDLLYQTSNFKVVEYYDIYNYGKIGFIFSAIELFKKYKINLKSEHGFGFTEESKVKDYFYINGKEAIVRSNTIPLKMIKGIRVNMTYSEIRFIYENIDKDEFRLYEVVKLYKKYKNKHWFIRKSSLMKVINSYNTIPPLVLTKNRDYIHEEVKNYNTEFDIDSDYESLLNLP